MYICLDFDEFFYYINNILNTGRKMMAVTKELHGKLSSTCMMWMQVEFINYDWLLQMQMSLSYRLGTSSKTFNSFPM